MEQETKETIENLSRERDYYKEQLSQRMATEKELISYQLKILSKELEEQIIEKFYNSLKKLLWIAGLLVGVATLGGYLSLKEQITQRIDDSIKSRSEEFRKLESDAKSDFINFSKESAVELALLKSESKKSLDEIDESSSSLIKELNANIAHAKVNVSNQREEMKDEVQKAKDLILATTKYWSAAKASIENAKGDNSTKADTTKLSKTDEAFLLILKCLRENGVKDPDVDVFYGVFMNDLDIVKKAMDMGANPVVTQGEIIKKHKTNIDKNCPGLLREY
jgi:hypothetical protein